MQAGREEEKHSGRGNVSTRMTSDGVLSSHMLHAAHYGTPLTISCVVAAVGVVMLCVCVCV